MSVVHLFDITGQQIITYDAVKKVTVTRTATVTKNTIQTGRKISDHYHSDLPSVTFTGLVSHSKIREVAPDPGLFTLLVNELIDAAIPFTLYGDPINGIPTLQRCVITNFSITKGITNLDSLDSAITVQQIDISDRAKKGEIAPIKSTNNQLNSGEDGGDGGKTTTDRTENKYTQMFKSREDTAKKIKEAAEKLLKEANQ